MKKLALFSLLALACQRPVSRPPTVLPLQGKPDGKLTRISRRAQVLLRGPRVEAKAGDWLLRHRDLVAVVSSSGKLIDFGPMGARDGLVSIEPAAFVGLEGTPALLEQIGPAGPHGNALYLRRKLAGRAVVHHAWIYLSGRALVIESALSQRGMVPPFTVAPGERVRWGNVPTWVEGTGFYPKPGTHSTRFVGRENLGIAYALCTQGGRTIARFTKPVLPGFHAGPDLVGPPLMLTEQASRRRVVALTASTRSLGAAASQLPCIPHTRVFRVDLPPGPATSARVEVADCSAGPAASYRAEGGSTSLRLRPGCHRARLVAPGHAPGPWARLREKKGVKLAAPTAGKLSFQATEEGKPIPARVRVTGLAGSANPNWGEDPNRGASLNVIYSEHGRGTFPLPPGRYRVTVDRGFEYSLHAEEIAVAAGRTVQVRAALRRVVDTTGWLAADLHLHSAPSPDAPQPLADRIRALVAVGVEVGVATEHNAVADYAPAIRALGMGRWVASVVGDEVTAKEALLGHFNVFPLAPGSRPLPWKGTTVQTIFAAARAALPRGTPKVIQVNHPRMDDIGYFNLVGLDPSDVKGSLARSPAATTKFDAIEVFNGDHYAEMDKVQECLRDWYALLNAGLRYTATGNSDSHKLTYHEAGVPRNLIQVPRDDPAAFDEKAFIAAIRAGKVVVSSGPFIKLTVAGKGLGARLPPGLHEVAIRVEAPAWVDVDRVELMRRGEVIRTWRVSAGGNRRPRFETKVRLPLKRGDWVIALARGSKPMTILHRRGAMPFAFTNPIWVE